MLESRRWFILTVIITVLIALIVFRLQLVGGQYAAATAGYAQVISSTTHISPPPQGYSLTASWQGAEIVEHYFFFPSLLEASISTVLGFNARVFSYFPVNILLLVVWWIVAFEFTKSSKFATFYFLAFFLFFRGNYFAGALISRASFGYVYFGLFLVGVYKLVSGRSLRNYSNWLIVTSLAIFATMYTYYNVATDEIFILSFVLGYLMLLRVFRNETSVKLRLSVTFVLISLFSFAYITVLGIRYGALVSLPSLNSYFQSVERSVLGSLLDTIGLDHYYQRYSLYTFGLPRWLSELLDVQKLAYLPIGVLIIYWLGHSFSTLRRAAVHAAEVRWEYLLAIASVAMLAADVITYGALEHADKVATKSIFEGVLTRK